MRLVLLGLPGSGKGTQGSLLARHYQVPHIATGALIRDHIARGTAFGRKVEAAIAAGNFAPDADILNLVSRRLSKSDAAPGYVLDGFPRDLAQAEEFTKHLRKAELHLDGVVELLIAEETLIERLSGRLVCPLCGESYHVVNRPPKITGSCDKDGTPLTQRRDDTLEAIRHRFEIYNSVTLPLREYYAEQGDYRGVNAEGDVSEVFARIVFAIEGRNPDSVG